MAIANIDDSLGLNARPLTCRIVLLLSSMRNDGSSERSLFSNRIELLISSIEAFVIWVRWITRF
jgi:hypothetical protein